MSEVKLPREVAEVIESLDDRKAAKECLHDIPYMIRCVKDGLPDGSVFEPIVKFYLADNKNKISYFQALVNGYEVEMNPEEEVLEYFKSIEGARDRAKDARKFACYNYELSGIITTLNKLKITIKGLNDHV